jgi:hypothetical protein
MPKGFWYWLIVVALIIAWLVRYRNVPVELRRSWAWYPFDLVLLILLILIGLTLYNDPMSTLVTGR